jgi:alanine racemase
MENPIPLKPVMSLVSQVSYFKIIEEGCSVSYGSTWTASKPTRIATIPIGYGDGYQRALSNKAEVIINGNKHAIVGNICMDQLMVNLTDHSAYNGDQVILIGDNGNCKITVEELADKANTVPHHILTNLNERIPRFYNYWYN